MKSMIIAALAVLAVLAAADHDVPYLASPAGRCMVHIQPDILLGAAPGFVTALSCEQP